MEESRKQAAFFDRLEHSLAEESVAEDDDNHLSKLTRRSSRIESRLVAAAGACALPEEEKAIEAETAIDSIMRKEEDTSSHVEDAKIVKAKRVNCYICLEDTAIIATAACGHWACHSCLFSWVNQHRNCPTCRKEISSQQISIVDISKVEGASAPVVPPGVQKYGTKPWAVLNYCRDALLQDESARILVFSSHDESLKILVDSLKMEGISSILCGHAADLQVSESIARFQAPDCEERILLLSSQNTAAGTNLQMANHVLFLEPAGMNPSHLLSVETQAVGRTVRLGQERHVKVQTNEK